MPESTLAESTESACNGVKSTESCSPGEDSSTGSTAKTPESVMEAIQSRLGRLQLRKGIGGLEGEIAGRRHETPAWPLLPTRAMFGLDTTVHPKVEELVNKAVGFGTCLVKNKDVGVKWFVVVGNTGCGKTHVGMKLKAWWDAVKIVAWRTGWHFDDHIPHAVFVDFPKLCKSPEWKFEERLDEVRDAKFVVLDDIGAETDPMKSGEPMERLREVLNAIKGKWAYITTNVPTQDWDKRWGQRVADRLMWGRVFEMFEVKSYRVTRVKA